MERSQYKRGRLSKSDWAYIKEHADKSTPEAIAAALGKDPKTVRQYIVEHCFKAPVGEELPEQELQHMKLKAEIKNSPEWNQLKEEFEPEEIEYFEHRCAKLLHQFKDDILPTEESQIFLLIKYELLMHRNRSNYQKTAKAIKRISAGVQKMYRKYNNDPTQMPQPERDWIAKQEEIVVNYRGSQSSSIREFNDMKKEHSSILKDLKATRDQRIEKLQNSNKTFVDLLKALQDEEFRERESRQIALYHLATDKEKERLGSTHKFINDETDQPILSSDTV